MNPFSFLEDRIGALSVDDFEIYQSETRLFTAQAREGEVEFTEEAIERGIALRLFKEGRVSFCSSSDWTPPFLERMLDLSYNGLSVLKEDVRFELPGPRANGGSVGRVERLSPPAGEEVAIALERAARGFDVRIVRVRDARYAEEVRTIRLKNSRGLDGEGQATRHELSLMVMAEGGGNQEMAWEEDFSPSFEELKPEEVAGRAAEKALSQLGAAPVATQKTPALLDPVVGASFLGVLSSSFLGDQVQKNRSALRERLGKEIYSKEVTLVDDGRYPGGYATFPFDGEGISSRQNRLVSDGVLGQFLYDCRSAVRAGRVTTGNAVRSGFKEPPRVGATNFFIRPGRETLESLLAFMGNGFWIRDLIGIHTADAVTGDFSVGASGIWIEGGRRRGPVRGVTLSGNLHDLFRKVVKVGSELRFYRSYGSPPLLIEEVDIGGL